MMKHHLLLLGAVSLIIPMAIAQPQLPKLTIGESAIAQMPPCPPPPPMRGMESGNLPEPPWAKNLNLSTEQRSRLQAIHQQGIKGIEEVQKRLFAADNQLRSLLESSVPLEQLRQQHQQIQALRQQLDNNHFEMMLAEREVLTPEQIMDLKKFMQQQSSHPCPNFKP
jgi:Spy/CpxP family protein refolding chaperone